MSYILKHFDIPLLEFNLTITIIDGFSLEITKEHSQYSSLFPKDLIVSSDGVVDWLRKRVIPQNRAFVHNFLAKLGLNVKDTKGIIDISKGLSLNDCYWIVDSDFVGKFAEYNLYDNRFSRILSWIAFTGHGETNRKGFYSTPELTTNGMLAKCWRRVQGDIVLYKAGSSGAINTGKEPYSEFYAFQIAQAMELDVTEYKLSRWKGELFSTCKLFTSKEFAYLPIGRVVTKGGWSAVFAYYKLLGEEYYDTLIDMLIFDAVVCNEDRHFGNFGLKVENKTNKIVGTAPIFDNGLSLFNYAMDDELEDIEVYAKTRLMVTSQDFLLFTKEIITPRQKERVRKLINFRFKRHSRYNLDKKRLKIIEKFIQIRVQEILGL